jgi:hypothetical protein
VAVATTLRRCPLRMRKRCRGAGADCSRPSRDLGVLCGNYNIFFIPSMISRSRHFEREKRRWLGPFVILI